MAWLGVGTIVRVGFAIVTAACMAGTCSAKDIVRQAMTGQPTEMWVYLSWHRKDCSPNIGVVKLVRKPQHGTLKTSQVDSTITNPRDRERNAHCIGKPAPGFRVEYTSEPNYRGPDSFQIHVTFGTKRPEADNFTVNVQ